jgi:hypothetical protein
MVEILVTREDTKHVALLQPAWQGGLDMVVRKKPSSLAGAEYRGFHAHPTCTKVSSVNNTFVPLAVNVPVLHGVHTSDA